MQTRRTFLRTMGLAAAGLVVSKSAVSATRKSASPNFIIIIADDVGWNDLGAYGHPHIQTPNLDEMAAEGLRFNNAFLTISSCSPSRCSIMTGRYPHATGAGELHQPLPADQVMFPALLKEAGYHTVCAGKWHLGDDAQTAFDAIVGGGPSGCDQWVDMLQKRPKEKPFFMWFAAHDAHRGWNATTGTFAIAKPHKEFDVVVPPFLPDTPEVRQDLMMYYDETTRLDGYVGDVLRELKKQGIEKDTFVLFLSDNGRPFPRCKTTIYDSGVKTPFIVRWPGSVASNMTTDSLVSSVDIAPTILALAGLENSPTFQGKSFAPILKDSNVSVRDYVFAEHNWHDYQAHERSVRSQNHLLIRNAFPKLSGSPPADAVRSPTFQAMLALHDAGKLNENQLGCFTTPRPAIELYDVEKDPYSLKNIADDPACATVRDKLLKELDAWVVRTNDRVPDNPTPDRFDRKTGTKLK